MKAFVIFFAALLVLSLPHSANAITEGETSRETIVFQKKTRTYYLFMPQNLTAGKPAPLILLLHGSGGDGAGMIDIWKNVAQKEGIFLAGPNAIDRTHWSWGDDGPDFLHDVVELSGPSHRSIHDASMSLATQASFALMMSLLESEYSAATAIHAGTLTPEEYSLIGYARRKIPIMIFVGDRDQFVPLTLVRGTRDSLVSKGFPSGA
jgi:predicted esterase